MQQANAESASEIEGSALPNAAEPTLEDMLRQIGGSTAVRDAADVDDASNPSSYGSRVMSDDRYEDLVQYLQLRQITLAPCHDARGAAWRRNAVSAVNICACIMSLATDSTVRLTTSA